MDKYEGGWLTPGLSELINDGPPEPILSAEQWRAIAKESPTSEE